MRADKLFAPFPFERSRGALSAYDLHIKDVVTVASEAGADTVYVCLKTPISDGYRDAVRAYAGGCRCFVASRGLGLPEDAAVYLTEDPEFYLGDLAARCLGYPARELVVFGVTGTHGKTSVIDTASALLRQAGKRVAKVGKVMSFASMTICLSSSGASSAREEVSERIGLCRLRGKREEKVRGKR